MAKTITVSTSADLYKALASATGGETILLTSGNYGTLSLGKPLGATFPSSVTIASSDPNHPAVFSAVALNGVSNLSIDHVVFDYTAKAGITTNDRPNQINGCTNISITNSVFDGDNASGSGAAADGYGTAVGLSVRWGSGITIANNEFLDWHRGAIFDSTSNLQVLGNDIHDVRSDGMDFANIQKALIENNYLHDFRASYSAGDHRDMIQFWTTGTKTPSTDITIRGNTLDIGDGAYTQSIFMRNEMVDTGQAGAAMFYKNILIENNTIYNGHLHGITVGETNGLVIRNNSVLESKDANNPADSTSPLWTPTIRVSASSTAVSISDNAVAAIVGYTTQGSWSVKNNAFVQASNPTAPGYYGDVFIDSTLDSSGGQHHFVAAPGSMLETLQAGSAATHLASAPTTAALYSVTDVAGNAAARVFDASVMSTLMGGALNGATFQWSFGDGTTASGMKVQHSFASGGDFDVQLLVKLANGAKLTAVSEVGIAGSKVLAFDGANHNFVSYDNGTAVQLGALAKLDGNELQLGVSGTSYKVAASHLTELKNADDVTINFTLQADKAGTSGELFKITSAFQASVTAKGQLAFQAVQDGTFIKMTTKSAILLNDGKSHNVSIDLDNGLLRASIDGKVVGQIALGHLPPKITDLEFGSAFTKAHFLGDISSFTIDVNTDQYGKVGSAVLLGAPTLAAKISQLAAEPIPAPVAAVEAVHHDLVAEALGGVDYKLNLASFAGKTDTLVGTAATGFTSAALRDGDDYLNIGRLKGAEQAEQLAFSVDFSRQPDSTGGERLVWNHMKVGLSLTDDGLFLQVGEKDLGLGKGFSIKGLGLDDTEKHNAAVLLDAAHDRLQVVLDNQVVLDVSNVDLDFIGGGGREWGWTLGSAWNHDFTGDIYAFSVDTDFNFIDTSASHIALA